MIKKNRRIARRISARKQNTKPGVFSNFLASLRGKDDAAHFQFIKSRSFLLMVVLFSLILVLAFFFGDGGVIEIVQAQTRIDELRNDITRLEKEKEELIKEIEELKRNPMALEKKAREKLWLMKKNEKVVVIIRDEKKNTPPKK